MKEKYTRPVVANSDVMDNLAVLPVLAGVVGLAAGYTTARKITQAVKAAPSIKLPSLTHHK